MQWPSTNNLYRSIAIFGLVVVIGSTHVLLDKFRDYNRQREAWNAASHELWVQALERTAKRVDDIPHDVRSN
jgi:hypothetical protein